MKAQVGIFKTDENNQTVRLNPFKAEIAIFKSVIQDTMVNFSSLGNFIAFPVLAFIMTEFIAKPDPYTPNDMFVGTFAAMFAGMVLIMQMAAAVATDREYKTLRFLMMAGVKPHSYLIGTAGAYLSLSLLVTGAFAFIGGYTGVELLGFVLVMILGLIASMTLGMTIGIFCDNQQKAIAMSTPVGMGLMFLPMFGQFNEHVYRFSQFLFNIQINTVVSDLSANFGQSLLIILANIMVFVVLFVTAFKVKGFRF
ncbi:MAG: ABC transporter permease [Streptococcaceae bacterium]|jgi:F0F1-type ATP synthase assembly protein I|nr:ABC transporter permease [Streptococcaceae bacterium]